MWQTRNYSGEGGKATLKKFSPHVDKCDGCSLELLDIVQKIGAFSENTSLP